MLTLNRILAPIDFSARSAPAIEHAVNVAKHFNAEVVFLHVVPAIPYAGALASGFPGGRFHFGPGVEDELKERLDQLIEEVAPGHGGERVVVSGPPPAVICDKVEELGIDMIVIPTSGAGVFRRFLLGSVVTKVLHDVSCPVFTGAHVEEIETFALRPYVKIGCAIDLDSKAARVLQFASDLSAAYRADLTVVHAIPAIPNTAEWRSNEEFSKELQERAQRKAQELIKTVGFEVPLHVESGQPGEVVSAFAKQRRMDLLVVGRHESDGPLSGLRANAYEVIRSAPCPVVSV